ncbi:branched-chain amino acid aminotransferase [Tsuneonella rigui]|uniref:branched-chain amino acid aminotransferase n=1 Tax=Tsuneonella rigui TaxID=1708790 RepID=UPI000F7EFDD6
MASGGANTSLPERRVADDQPSIEVINHPSPTPYKARLAQLLDPGFGSVFTDHMVSISWSEGLGWHDAILGPRTSLSLDPATAALHYGQSIFEGMKAFRQKDGGAALFRPFDNARRFNSSADRLAMPGLPETLFVEAVRKLVERDRDWFPDAPAGALYIRPFMFASEPFLGVRPARAYTFLVIASPVGSYFSSRSSAISLWVSENHTRAAPGGTGAAKCCGNYAASLLPQRNAIERGYDQVVFLDAVENRWIEELGGMNLFFAFKDGSVITPPLSGTILPGITRDTVITLLRDQGLHVQEQRYSMEQWADDAATGLLTETFACGTAASITAVGKVASSNRTFTIGDGKPGPVSSILRQLVTSVQFGVSPDRHGWLVPV